MGGQPLATEARAAPLLLADGERSSTRRRAAAMRPLGSSTLRCGAAAAAAASVVITPTATNRCPSNRPLLSSCRVVPEDKLPSGSALHGGRLQGMKLLGMSTTAWAAA